jgi:hypothetical protein
MIKKFEEFVNEMYSPTSFKRGVFDFIDYLESVGMTDDNIRAEIYDIAMNNRNFYYTPEETENILKRLPGCDSIEGIIDAVKTVFFGTDEDFKNWCGDAKCPVVRGVNGKLLTGVVYYSEFFDEYAEDEMQWEEKLAQMAIEQGVPDDEQTDWIDNRWEDLEIEEVDLDKQFGWREE